jgi:transcription initiation factor TFIIIB Brf1 subunit/transcription initiation factor TFIIB
MRGRTIIAVLSALLLAGCATAVEPTPIEIKAPNLSTDGTYRATVKEMLAAYDEGLISQSEAIQILDLCLRYLAALELPQGRVATNLRQMLEHAREVIRVRRGQKKA